MNLIESTNYYLGEAVGVSPELAVKEFPNIVGSSFAFGDNETVFQYVMPKVIQAIENQEDVGDVLVRRTTIPVSTDQAEKLYSLVSQYFRKGSLTPPQIGLLKSIIIKLNRSYGEAIKAGYRPNRTMIDKQASKQAELGHELGRNG